MNDWGQYLTVGAGVLSMIVGLFSVKSKTVVAKIAEAARRAADLKAKLDAEKAAQNP